MQTVIEFAGGKEYAKTRDKAVEESRHKSSADTIYLIGHDDDEIDSLLTEIYRCREIYKLHRNKATDKEVEEYLRAQEQRADSLTRDLAARIEKGLSTGSFVFSGRPVAVAESGKEITKALTVYLAGVAEEVFHKYAEAAHQTDSGTAERLLKTDRLDKIASQDDPLGLVKGGAVDRNHKAIVSITNHLQQQGQVEGRRLLDDFYAAPYGWTKDTTRYITAAMLVGGLVKLRVAGEDVTVRGETAVSSLRNTNGFNSIGVALRDNAPPAEAVMRARDRLLELTGDEVLPLEEEVSKCVIKHFPEFQKRYAPLAYRLDSYSLPGVPRAESIQDSLSELLRGDASDAANR
ncbi:MAG: BREX system P-loop protein BrxC, partial [Proteobacteria bacterium]|nr:BREX system P-loop protein BrxC [Pseudomonadota bacterium]